MEYTYTISAEESQRVLCMGAVVATSSDDAIDKIMSLEYHPMPQWDGVEGISVSLTGAEPALVLPGIPATCQMCKVRPVRRVVCTPWDASSPNLFLCDTPNSTGDELYCMASYTREHDGKHFDMPPATVQYHVLNWMVQRTMDIQ